MAMDFNKSRNAKKVSNIATKSKDLAENEIVLNLPLKDLRENPENEKIVNMDKVDEIAAWIKETEYVEPLQVRPSQDGTYTIISGHTRYRALSKLGRETVKCIIKDFEENKYGTREIRMRLAANIHREHSPMDIAREMNEYSKLLKIEQFKGDKRKEIARLFGKSSSQVHKYLSLLTLIPDLQELIEDKWIGYTSLSPAGVLGANGQMKLYQYILHQRNLYMAAHGYANLIDRSKEELSIADKSVLEECYAIFTRPLLHKVIEYLKYMNANDNKNVRYDSIPSISAFSNKEDELENVVEHTEKKSIEEQPTAGEEEQPENQLVSAGSKDNNETDAPLKKESEKEKEKGLEQNKVSNVLIQFEKFLDEMELANVTFADEDKQELINQYKTLKMKIDDELDRLGA